jgi:hypothetical protein
LTKGATPTFGPTPSELVEYGVARLRNDHQGAIVEPLAFLSLLKWFEKQPTLALETGIQLRLGEDSSCGDAYEQLVILYLLRALRYPVLFGTVFDFHRDPLSWADETTSVVGHVDGIAVPVDVLGDHPQNPGLGVVQYAANIAEVLKWIEIRPP